MQGILQAVHDTWLGDYTRAHAWVFTTGLVIHFIGLCVLLGAMLVVDLRLMGLGRTVPVKAVLSLLPLAIAGFAVNLLTGLVFFCFDPFGYWLNPAFKIKMVLVLIAGANALLFTVVEQPRLLAQGDAAKTEMLTRISASASLVIWFAVVLFGRLIVAFQGSPDLFK